MPWQDQHKIADQAVPAVERRFLAAIAAIQRDVDIAQLVRAIQMGNAATVMAVLNVSEVLREAVMVDMSRDMGRVFVRSGLSTESDFPLRLNLRFNLLNPEAVAYARAHAGELVAHINESARQLIHDVTVRGFTEGNTVQTMAREIRSEIGLTPQLAGAVQKLRAALRMPLDARRLVASGMHRVEVAQRLGLIGKNGQPSLRMLDNQLAKPVTPLDEIERRAAKYAAKLTRHRAETIALDQTLTASAAGRNALWQQAIDKGYMSNESRRFCVTTPDDRNCGITNPPGCLQVPGMNPHGVRMDEPYQTPWGPRMYPPFHVRCRDAERIEIVAARVRLAA